MSETQAAQAEEEVVTETTEAEQVAAPEANEDSAPQTTAEAETPDTGAQEDTDGIQKRINTLTWEKHEERRKREAAERELEQFKSSQTSEITEPVRPKESDFDYDSEQYQQALSKYESDLVDYRIAQREKQRQEAESQHRKRQRQQEIQANWNNKVAESNIEGFAEAMQVLPIFDPSVLETLMVADNGAQVAYYLSQHLDQAEAIASASPVLGAMQIGSISTRLSLATNKKQETSAAPEPIDPITQTESKVGSKSPLLAGAIFE